MADLEFFDKLVLAKEEPKEEAAPAAEGAGVAEAVSPAAKRRRRQLKGEAASAGGAAPKSEVWQENVNCNGCGRQRETGKAFHDKELDLVWAYPDGRGSWCHDCFCTWRTGYAHEHTLRLFEKWLLFPENFQDFQVHLLAWVTLAHENCAQVRPSILLGRVVLLRLVAKMMGIPLGPFAVTLLDGSSGPLAEAIDPRSLVHVVSTDGPRIGMLVPISGSAAAVQQQPFARGFFQMCCVLPQGTEPDVRQVLRLLGDSAATDGSAISASSLEVAAVIPVASPATRLGGALQIQTAAAKLLLQPFEGETWAGFKETSVIKCLAAVSALRVEAGTEGNESVFRLAETLAQGLSIVKKFARLHRVHKVTKTAFGKLSELAEPAAAVSHLLAHDLNMKASVSFSLLRLRASFAKCAEETPSLETAAKLLIREGLSTVLERLASKRAGGTSSKEPASTVNPALWLRVCFLEAAQAVLAETCTAEAAPQKAKEIQADLQAARDVLKASFPSPCALDEFFDDLTSLLIVVAGAAGNDVGHSPKQIQEAMARINSADFGQLNRALANSRVWQLARTSAAGVLQGSSKDALADEKLVRACTILLDERLPHMADASDSETGGRLATIENAGLVIDGTALDALEESVCSMTEAMSMWSKLRADQQGSAAVEWLVNLVKAASSLDEVHWLCMDGCVAKAGLREMVPSFLDDSFKETWVQFGNDLDENIPDDIVLEEFFLRLVTLVEGWSASMGGNNRTAPCIATIKEKLLPSLRRRVSAFNALASLSTLPLGVLGPDVSPKELVAEWRAKNQQGAAHEAPLARLLSFLKDLAKAEGCSDQAGDNAEEDVAVRLILSDQTLETSLQDACSLVGSMRKWPCIERARMVANCSFQVVLTLFSETLHMHDIVCEWVGRDIPDSLANALADFVAPAKAGILAKIAAKSLATKSRDANSAWPCEDGRPFWDSSDYDLFATVWQRC